MRHHDPTSRNHHVHQEAWELLPWYANGTLDGRECAAVEAHLPTCPACQAELQRCRDIATAVHAAGEAAWSPSPGHFSQLLARIDAAEAQEAQDGGWRERLRARYTRSLLALQSTPRLVRWALVTQGAMLLLLAGVLVWQAPFAPGPLYQTLSDGRDPVARGQAHIQVVFADEMTEKELRALLTGVGGTIVKGPSSEGVYTVAVPLSGSAPDLAGPVLDALRAHRHVLFAEPLPTR